MTYIRVKFRPSRLPDSSDLHALINDEVKRLRKKGKTTTAEAYLSASRSFLRFTRGKSYTLSEISAEVILSYESWLKDFGLARNTTSFYMRRLRAVYNKAVRMGLTDDRKPFRGVFTGSDKTVKRAIAIHDIKKLKNADFRAKPNFDFARDVFLLSFYLRGMSFIDMAKLKKSDLVGGRIVYRRSKTGQRIEIGWVGEMQAILDKYPANPTEYLLPIVTAHGVDFRKEARRVYQSLNLNIQKAAASLGIGKTTLYTARHCWASVAKALGVPLAVISDGMGHESESTTLIYLKSLDTATLDAANHLVISSLS